MSKVVCIDAGHAGRNVDPGACGFGLQEADINLLVALKVGKHLNNVGYTVIQTRTELEQPETDELSYRTNLSNDANADIFVSIHCNSASNENAQGTETWYEVGSTKGMLLAQKIQNQVVNSLGTVDRGLKEAAPGHNLYVLSQTDAPAALVELAFISNEDDVKLFSKDGIDCFARAVARGITDYFA